MALLEIDPRFNGHFFNEFRVSFKIHVLNNTNINLQNFPSNYTLLVNEATHICVSLLDHACVNKESLQKFSVDKTKIVLIFFSDHDVVRLRFQNKY